MSASQVVTVCRLNLSRPKIFSIDPIHNHFSSFEMVNPSSQCDVDLNRKRELSSQQQMEKFCIG